MRKSGKSSKDLKMIDYKKDNEIKIMQEGGLILTEIMNLLLDRARVGVSMIELDRLAEKEIIQRGGEPSFKKVPGYKWSICACVNEVVVHGIPDNYQIKAGDAVGIDCGVYYNGFHTDASWTVRVGSGSQDGALDRFLASGRKALTSALKEVVPGNYIYDVSKAIQTEVESAGYSVVKSLIGHGVGRSLHEEPEIPGFTRGQREDTVMIKPGLVAAVEVIYNMGGADVVYKGNDGWTIKTKDDKISGLFEATVGVSNHGVLLLTKINGTSGDNRKDRSGD